MPHSTAIAQFTLGDIWQPTRQGAEPTNELPQLIGRRLNIDTGRGSGLRLPLIDGQRSVCGDQLPLAHFVPEVIRNRFFQSGVVLGDARGLAGSWNDGGGGRMGERKVQGRSLK